MLTPLPADQILDGDWRPQALFTRPIEDFVRDDHPLIEHAEDDEVTRTVTGRIDGVPFLVRHYQGFPTGLVQFYVLHEDAENPSVLAIVARVMLAFGVTKADRAWQIGDDVPNLNTWNRALRSRLDAHA